MKLEGDRNKERREGEMKQQRREVDSKYEAKRGREEHRGLR